MTPQEKLQAEETAIRKALPRLTEPTEGCNVEFSLRNSTTKGKIIYKYIDGHLLIFSKDCDDTYYRSLESCIILGHDILLSDVLEWLGVNIYEFGFENIRFTNIIDDRYKIEIEREFLRGGIYKVKEWTGTLLPYVDFSKPRLADQSEELINYLYNLIEK